MPKRVVVMEESGLRRIIGVIEGMVPVEIWVIPPLRLVRVMERLVMYVPAQRELKEG